MCVCPFIRLIFNNAFSHCNVYHNFSTAYNFAHWKWLRAKPLKNYERNKTPTQNSKKDISYWFCMTHDFITTFGIPHGKQSMLFIVMWNELRLTYRTQRNLVLSFWNFWERNHDVFICRGLILPRSYTVRIGDSVYLKIHVSYQLSPIATPYGAFSVVCLF